MSKQEAEKSGTDGAPSLEAALRDARASDADYLDSRAKVSDLRFLRLDALREEIAKILGQEKGAEDLFSLNALPGDPPRLIIDAASHVVMEPDPRTYTFILDGPEARQVLCETDERREIESKVTEYIAHRILEQQRAAGTGPVAAKPDKAGGSGVGALLGFWLTGVIMGGLAVYAYLHPERFILD